MLEGLVAWVLNNYLGKYVENLNTDQLSVALLSGKVELENLPLKKDALRHLGLPVEIKAGFIGKVQLHVPVRQIRSAPWLIAIEKLYLVAAPVNLDEWDSAAEAAFAHERKVAILDALEAQWRAEHEASDAGYYAASYSSWLSYGTGLLANIVENLQLKLNDVHIRYEDALTCAPSAFACGLAVESLAAESCDAEWRRGFTPPAEPCSFKLLELHHLAVYWDPMPVPAGMMADCTIAELTERMRSTWESAHRFVVSPTGASARVRRERCEQPLRDRTRPRLACHLTLSAVALKLTQRQWREMAGCTRGLERVARLRDVRALRPDVPLRGHARAWWAYALRAHAPHHCWLDPKPSWESCLEQSRKTIQYVNICLVILNNPAGTLPPEKKAAKDEYEWGMPLTVLKSLREIAMRKVPVSTPTSTPEQASSGRTVLVRWFPQWWGWYAPTTPPASTPLSTPIQATTPAPLSGSATVPRLEDEILDVIADSLDDNTLLRRDAVFGLFEFTLEKGSLDLCTESEDETNGGAGGAGAADEGVELQFSAVLVRVESRPRAGAHSLHVSLGALCLRERITPRSLFPVLVAPQGMIREGLGGAGGIASVGGGAWRRAASPHDAGVVEPLFQLSYERRPAGMAADYRLRVKSRSIEVVWSQQAARWAARFIRAAGGPGAQRAIAHVRDHTRARLMTQWERLVHQHHQRRPGPRGSWAVELDISAPQILLVEQLCSRDSPVIVLDFGRLRLANAHLPEQRVQPRPDHERERDDDDDEEMFMTPCSTPPGSPLSPASPPVRPAPPPPIDVDHLHSSLYDRYNIELSDLQILVGRARDNWKYAHTKTTSALHLLDRFSISLQAERRVVATSEPQWPRAALCGSLPALTVHLSEHKLAAVRAVLAAAATSATDQWKETPGGDNEHEAAAEERSECSESERSELSAHHNATLFVLQFAIDQMSLEVQSRGRSIAEVQVMGVRAALATRPADTSLSLSVHSLLLVDALQTHGPDFELLVASHKHVGMDTASGSIRGSEPTSPTSPASPDARAALPAPTPLALHRAVYSLHHAHNFEADRVSPTSFWMGASFSTSSNTYHSTDGAWGEDAATWGSMGGGGGGGGWAAPGLVDSEALIAIELCFVKGDGDSEDLRIANILFNNLDVIANQETIVELIGFAHRVMGAGKPPAEPPPVPPEPPAAPPAESPAESFTSEELQRERSVRTEITFDFHRLGVLLVLAASKVATATLGEARIQATLDGPRVDVSGSLGGVQVVSLCEGAGLHSRILCAGRTPAHHDHAHGHAHHDHLAPDDKALFFSISRTVQTSNGADPPVVEVKVNVHVASVWYTHSDPLLRELRSCLAQFQQYLANLGRSIRAAAADMAIGLVHPRGDTLYANPRLAQSMEGVSPRRRTASVGCSLDEPDDDESIILSVSVELESPVAVVARAAHSPAVFVAHLGRMSLSNRPGAPSRAHYSVRVRDISLVSLEVDEEQLRQQLAGGVTSMADMYDVARGRPVLHDTELHLAVDYEDLLDGPTCSISGKVVGGLHVTASREQYEQLLDTLRWVSGADNEADTATAAAASAHAETSASVGMSSSALVEPAVPTLQLDPALRAAVLAVPPPLAAPHVPRTAPHTPLTVTFELATFTVELRADLGGGERSLVALTFREFSLQHEHLHPHETTLQVSLHSITMEDLTKEPDSKHRMLMVSHTPPMPPKAVYVSKSCPDFVTEFPDDVSVTSSLQYMKPSSTSLPGELHVVENTQDRERGGRAARGGREKRESACATPPCSPEQPAADQCGSGNLVWLSVHTRRHTHPRFHDLYDKVGKLTKVEFNCLKLVLSIDSWVAVLDFFGVVGDEPPSSSPAMELQQPEHMDVDSPAAESGVASETEISVRSLSVVVVGARGDACRALVSRAHVHVRGHAGGGRSVNARLGALALADLTPRAPLWRDRLRTRTTHALTIEYHRLSTAEAAAAGHDTSLALEMGPLTYVHTRRFVLELQAFARDFGLLRCVLVQARRKVSSVPVDRSAPARMRLHVRVSAPVIVVPVSGRSRAALVVDLQLLQLDNCFRRAGDPDTVSTLLDPENPHRSLLDVRSVRLEGVALWCARGGRGLRVRRRGPPLLPAPARLALALETSLDDKHDVPDVTLQGTLTTLQLSLDAAQYKLIRGVLAHNLAEPCSELLPPPPPAPPSHPAPATTAGNITHSTHQVWTTWSMKLDLQDVMVTLRGARTEPPLACINFIKSRLLVENYSDLSQDIDLVSQEILVSDTRYAAEPANRRGNVFSHIVQPLPDHQHSVQAEVHARKRQDSAAYTILVNNMRLMAILDWWEAAGQLLLQAPPPPADPDHLHFDDLSLDGIFGGSAPHSGNTGHMELKLNITDSQLVLVEDASVWDTNAVILKSTTVITYRASGGAGGGNGEPALVCEVNELEVFSCVLGLEEETALSILDPAALTATLRDRLLHISTGALNLRLSYHDMRMFAAMLHSLPQQARVALSGKTESQSSATDAPANSVHMRAASPSGGMLGGVSPRPRLIAPRWARPPPPPPPPEPSRDNIWPLRALQVNADCVTLCVIDDCLDSDVPLLEMSLAELQLEQDLRKVEESFEDPLLVSTPSSPVVAELGAPRRTGAGGGRLRALLSADYYNRLLSGWEPVLEPWRFEAGWEYTLSSALSLRRVQVEVISTDTLNTNVTSALVDLCRLVRANWAADYYAPQSTSTEQSPKGSPAGHRRRSPFVPYALRNLTGHRLWFTTILTTSDELHEIGEAHEFAGPDDSWMCVRSGDTEPFSFGARRGRGRGAGGAAGGGGTPAALHRVALRLDGWGPVDPVCVDRVGVFFRHLTHIQSGLEARIVLQVSLEGSARKLVTVRSALQLVNNLPHAVDVRLHYAPASALALAHVPQPEWCAAARATGAAARARACVAALRRPRALPAVAQPLYPIFYNCAQWSGGSGSVSRGAIVAAGDTWAAPLAARAPAVWTRPLPRAPPPAPALAPAAVDWRAAGASGRALLHYECRAPHGQLYRFCCVIVRERFPPERGEPIAGHTMTLVPALRLENLLPLELQYRAGPVGGTLAPGDTRPFHEVNVEEGVEVSVKLEGFGWSSALSVSAGAGAAGGSGAGGSGGAVGSFSARLKLRDQRSRRLYLNARVTIKKTDGVKVSISAAYWVVNRTGLPLVFRAEVGGEAAGQGPEHEVARMVAPLPFCFADTDPPTLAARLGTQVAPNPEWCSPFGLGPGVTVKKLEGGERTFAVGVSVRAGRGRYRRTNIVTLAPRYQLHNNTLRHLQFAQKCTATTLNDPGAMATHVSAVAGCYLPWHWARWEREQLLCVRVLAPRSPTGTDQPAPLTAWSGGFRIDSARSLHVACRENGGGGAYVVLRVEVVLEGAMLLVALTDGESAPPPLRIDNYSRVAIMFHQVGCNEECVVGAGARVRWALPEPEGTAALALRAPGGPRLALPLDAPPNAHQLLYQNFVYVAFTASAAVSAHRENDAAGADDDGVLVLEVPLGSTRVILAHKRYGDRSQLWRRGPSDQLIHEGSSPPQPTDATLSDESALSPHAMVLDIEGAAPRPARAAPLALRRADPRRASTQAWRLLPPGRMACAHANLCVQPEGGLMGLAPGNRVVLGLAGAARSGARVGTVGGYGMARGIPVPPEESVAWHTLRPGSGRLTVSLSADGPTRLVRIHDHNDPEARVMRLRPEEDEEENTAGAEGAREWGLRVALAALSVSLVARSPPAELVYALFAGVRVELAHAPRTAHFTLTVDNMQWDNQLLGTPSPVLLYCLPERAGAGGAAGAAGAALPALHAAAELAHAPARRYNALFFNHFVVALRPIAVRLEERLILLLWSWARADLEGEERALEEGAEEEQARPRADPTAPLTRYYFAVLKLIPSQIRLSMFTASKLEGSLSALKRRLGLTLIRFEDAAVELEPFVRAHAFDTPAALATLALHHFKDELKWQAAKILGSVDFLGNPLGFVADVSEGVSGLLLEGNVSALLKNVTHGISNSAAKVTESLGDGLERVVGDEAHEETRRRIRSAAAGPAGAHLAAGLRGLGLGILGGMTSLVKHSYEGAAAEGLGGLLAGVGKGLVGTVTKPVIGVLDLAAETAAALRDSSRRAGALPSRARPPRLAAAAAALLPRYCAEHAQGAALLHALNGHDYSERFLAYRQVRDTPHDIRALLSDTYLRIFTCKHTAPQVVMETHLSNLVSCTVLYVDGAHLVELGVRGGGGGGAGSGAGEALRRPRVQCDSAALAAWLARHAAYARQLHHDQRHTLLPHADL